MAAYGLKVLAPTCPTCGTIKVYEDGKLDTRVSLRSSATRHRRVVWMSDNGEEGFFGRKVESSSTITIKVVTDGRPVIIEAVVLGVCPGCS